MYGSPLISAESTSRQSGDLRPTPMGSPAITHVSLSEVLAAMSPADRATRLMLQSLGQAEPEMWISAEAVVM